MSNDFTKGEQALIRQTAVEVVKADREEHRETRELELKAFAGQMGAQMGVEMRAITRNHIADCPALKVMGRLRVWVPITAGGIGGAVILIVYKSPVVFSWIVSVIGVVL